MAELDRRTRERLLEKAEQIISTYRNQEEGEKIVKMSAKVLFELKRRRDLDWMKKLLNAAYASDMGKDHWNAFRKEMNERLSAFQTDFPNDQQRVAAWLYFLGWLHRLANQAKSPRRPEHSRPRGRRGG